MAADPNSRGAARECARHLRRDTDGFVRTRSKRGGCYWRVKRRVLGHRAVVAAWALVARTKGRIGVVRYLIGIL